ncbi:MAG: AAA family ATPase, partial [Oscillospiraceae bacterium]|nr:AAA family ATPase [Oscillospiraceae bacterium]
MQLKSIELQGFKSFPEKTRLAFEKPVTVIVGPNGSGKSNLADAILWVMGEQSTRTLRGGKMEDVIFGGTQKRAQVGFAEVSLILDNLDGTLPTENTEVMITRRYYRSGESEYYINRKLSRLRDINELLMDTGLGREGYSVIGQGKIDDILSAKSHDRRLIFEEAVGISRYRHRKEEAEHRLAQTDENLVRINDIIAELELQLTPLREQSETARRYLRLRDELRELEVSLWALNLDKLAERIEKSDGDHNAAAAQLAEMTRALEDGYENAETFAQRLRDKDVEADAVREAVSDRERRSGELESAIAALKTQRESNHIRIGGIEQELSRQESRDGGLESQLREREARIEQIAAERGDAEARLRALEETMRQLAETSSREENEFFALAERETSLGGTAGERRERLSALALQAQELLDRENGAGAELGRLSEEMDALAVSSGEAEASLSEAREEDASLLNVVNGFLLRENSRREKAAEAE